MKLNTPKSTVEISGAVGAPSSFGIAASVEAFRTLSSGLYSDKIRAVIRELACNAYDAHVAAGRQDVPFYIHLPTSYEPFFAIKDSGTGLRFTSGGCPKCKGRGVMRVLSEDDVTIVDVACVACGGTGDYDAVRSLYTTYFGTDKSDSNDFIGAFGLGSKSPFAYQTDGGFSVTNTYEGVTRIYAAYINDLGMPDVLLQVVEETPDRENGVEVSFPVDQKDVREFHNKAEEALEFFVPEFGSPRPNLNTLITIEPPDYVIRTERWGLRRDNDEPRAIQGRVQYTLGDIDESRLNEGQRRVLNMPLDLFFEIGDLSPAASRETLQMDDMTIANILARLDEVSEHMISDIKAKMTSARSLWDARLLLYSLENDGNIGYFVAQAKRRGLLFGDYGHYQLTKDTTERVEFNQLDYPALAVFSFRQRYGADSAKKTELSEKALRERRESTGETQEHYRRQFAISLKLNESLMFVINDIGFGAEKYLHHYIQFSDSSRNVQTAILLTRRDKSVTVDEVIRQGEAVVAELGGAPVVRLSELREIYREERKDDKTEGRGPAKYIHLFEQDWARGNNPNAKYWYQAWSDVTQHDLGTAVKFYVVIKDMNPVGQKFDRAPDFAKLVRGLRESGLFGLFKATPIYGVKEWAAKKVQGREDWVELFGHVRERLEKVITEDRQLVMSLDANPFDSDAPRLFAAARGARFLRDSPLRAFIRRYSKAKRAVTSQTKSLAWVAEGMGFELKHTVDFDGEWEAIEARYPLLKKINDFDFHYYEGLLGATLEYIRLIDERDRTVARDYETTQTFAVAAPVVDDSATAGQEESYVN